MMTPSTTPHRKPLEHVTLRTAAGSRLVGAAIMSQALDDPQAASILATHFSSLTAENEMKPLLLQREKGTFTFEEADRIVDFARRHGQQVIGHTLCWHQQTPAWMFEDVQGQPLPRRDALENLRTHIHAVLRHFRGKVKGWDVVNEAVSDKSDEYLRDTPARRAIGDDYVIKAFEYAQDADPGVELYYNDYSIDYDYKRGRALRLVEELRSAGVRLDAVGIQAHHLLTSPSIEEIERGLRAFDAMGIKLMITELDVDPLPRDPAADLDPYRDGLPDAVQQQLASRYAALIRLFVRFPSIERITLWGVSDRKTWLNNFPIRGRTNHPLLWDRRYQPKPTFDAFLAALEAV